MAKIVVGNPDYDAQFEEEVSILDFAEWLFGDGRGFALNLVGKFKKSKRPLHEWIEMFLDWSEYSDYKTRRDG
jgi:hypothetical protein